MTDNDVDVVGDCDVETSFHSAASYESMELYSGTLDLLPHFTPSPWASKDQVWSLDPGLDVKVNTAGEKIPQDESDEQMVCSNVTVSTSSDGQRQGQRETHRKPWNEMEKKAFNAAIELYGRSWSNVSKHIGTRTTLQVKNYACQLLKQQQQSLKPAANCIRAEDRPTSPEPDIGLSSGTCTKYPNWNLMNKARHAKKGTVQQSTDSDDRVLEDRPAAGPHHLAESKEIIHLNKEVDLSDYEDIDIEELHENAHSNGKLTRQETCTIISDCNVEDTGTVYQDSVTITPDDDTTIRSARGVSGVEFEQNNPFEQTNNTSEDESAVRRIEDASAAAVPDQDDVSSPTVKSSSSSTLEFHDIGIPSFETHLDRVAITDTERKVHGEFFEGRQQKTPERYLKIRNYILDRWQNCRPHYLKKTSVRTGLKNCGDVNCIGRIHTYLEQIGAINFGCAQTVYVRPLIFNVRPGPASRDRVGNRMPEPPSSFRSDSMRKRKRKLPVCIDGELGVSTGGYTIHHGRDGDVVDVVQVADSHCKQRLPKSRDPFRLVPCVEFTDDFPAPFSLAVHVQALVVMDVHAHSSHLEVIGLLGGHHNPNTSTLHVTAAEPCESLSTGLECEMDPVSQTQASESLQQRGYQIVGWYHSHPTFAPNPSLRDLETQENFQNWFGKGGSPFIGVIISPFLVKDQANCTRPSMIQYLIIGDEAQPGTTLKQPYRFETTVEHCDQSFEEAMSQIWNLIHRRSGTSTDVNFPHHLTYLDKALQSTLHIMLSAKMDPETCKRINDRLKSILTCLQSSDHPTATSEDTVLQFCSTAYPPDSTFNLDQASEDYQNL